MKKDIIIVDSTQFKEKGGWVLDTQFIVNMGLPYLLAHGLGSIVDNAKATFTGCSGEYHAYVYNYNWVSPWHDDMSAGEFKINVNGTENKTVFGKSQKTWGFEYAGTVNLVDGENTLELIDLTGFDGRCGAVIFTKDMNIQLPSTPLEVTEFVTSHTTTEVNVEEEFELAVIGGGIAGICTALSASRNGVKTILIQDRSVVGGNNSSEVRVWLGGETNFEPYPSIGNIINELEQTKIGHYGSSNKGECYEDDMKLGLLNAEPNLTVMLNSILFDVKMEEDIIKSIKVWDIENSVLRTIKSKLFSDSTGDSTLAYMAGADYEVTTNGHMGMTNMWYIENTNTDKAFPRCPWAINLDDVEFPGRKNAQMVCDKEREFSMGAWFWEGGCELDPIEKAEYTRDLNFRAMYGAWDTLKNVDNDYPGYELGFSAYIGGKRESRRLFGDIVLTKSDVYKGVKYEDGFVPSTWNFDVHYPDRRFYEAFKEGDSFLTKDYHEPFNKPFFIPYRCLYSRNISNMFMAGRNVSTSHDALGTVRVMRTCGMMGEVVGYAAKMCIEKNTLPRGVYDEYLNEFKDVIRNIPKKELQPLVANVHAEGQ